MNKIFAVHIERLRPRPPPPPPERLHYAMLTEA